MSDEGVIRLSKAIVKQAFKDYNKVLKHGDKSNINRQELDSFFRGPLFGLMAWNADPESVIEGIRAGKYASSNRDEMRGRKCG